MSKPQPTLPSAPRSSEYRSPWTNGGGSECANSQHVTESQQKSQVYIIQNKGQRSLRYVFQEFKTPQCAIQKGGRTQSDRVHSRALAAREHFDQICILSVCAN